MYRRKETLMRRAYLGFLIVAAAVAACTAIAFSHLREEKPRECVRLPKESVYLGSVTFSDGEAHLSGAESENGKQVKRIAGTYILTLDKDILTVEIYSLGTRNLFKKEMYTIEGLQNKYPAGFSIWVEQDVDTAKVVFVPWM